MTNVQARHSKQLLFPSSKCDLLHKTLLNKKATLETRLYNPLMLLVMYSQRFDPELLKLRLFLNYCSAEQPSYMLWTNSPCFHSILVKFAWVEYIVFLPWWQRNLYGCSACPCMHLWPSWLSMLQLHPEGTQNGKIWAASKISE